MATEKDFKVKNGAIIGADITFESATTGGVLSWNNTESTLDITLNSQVTLQAGQETLFYAKATEAIANGDIVMFAGAQGDHLLIAKADMQSVGFTPEYVIGVATQSFNTNDFGYVTAFGKVRELDTDGLGEGTIIYLDPDTPGGWLTSAPTDGSHVIQLAAVVRDHQDEGTLFVRPLHKVHLDELEGTNFSNLQDGQAIIWDAANSVWVNGDSFSQTDFDNAIANVSIGDLSDVDTTSAAPTSGQVLKWNGTNWVPANDIDTQLSLASASIGDLGDVDLTTPPTTGQAIIWDGTSFVPGDSFSQSDFDTAFGSKSINSLSDVDTTSAAPTSGQVLKWNGTNWVPANDIDTQLSLASASIDDLGDVDITSTAPTNGQALVWDGTNFIPGDVAVDTTFIGLTDSPASYTGNAGRVVKVNSSADGVDFGDIVVGATTREYFTGNGSTTDYTLTNAYAGENGFLVFVDGVVQKVSEDYTYSGTTLSFNTAPVNSAEIFVYGTSPIAQNVPGDGTVTANKLAVSAYTRDTFDGNGSTTAFTLTRNPGSVYSPFVFVDGVIQDPITHYGISGTTITFTFAPASGTDNILVVYGPTLTAGTVSDGSITFDKLAPSNFMYQVETGDGTTTDFALDQQAINEQHLIVTVASVPQSPDGTTYTLINNGNTISFAAAPANGAKIIIRWYGVATYTTPVDNSVSTAKIQNSAVTSDKIADGSITAAKIADGTIVAAEIADGTITPVKLDREYATKGTSIALSIALG